MRNKIRNGDTELAGSPTTQALRDLMADLGTSPILYNFEAAPIVATPPTNHIASLIPSLRESSLDDPPSEISGTVNFFE